MLAGFKKFILRGNVVDLAVGVVIGAAFSGVVTSLVSDLLTPLIGAIAKVPDFAGWFFILNGSKIMIGSFLNHLISFFIVAAAIYFCIIMPLNALMKRAKKEPPADPTSKKCPECFSEIDIRAKRCAFCTTHLNIAEKK